VKYNLSMAISTPVTEDLESKGIPYRLYVHTKPLESLEQAARERDLAPEQIIRSLLFRCEAQSYVMVLMPGPSRVDWGKLRRFLKVSRITTATSEEVLTTTGYPTGAVSPFGLPGEMRVLADDRICDHVTISLGAGIRNAGVILQRDDLLRSISLEFGDFTSP
jgi:Cys-tRNA(Pro) deacylase